jgi:hypothetical protein
MIEPCDYEAIEREERPQAVRIAQYMHMALPPTTRILDVGCGPGLYVEELRKRRFDALGVDNDPRLPDAPGFFSKDVPVSTWTNTPCDVVLSLEVGEHIPASQASGYLNFIDSADPSTIYFSAARPGQGGHGHINCQPKVYWTRLFHRKGFYYDPDETDAWLTFMRSGYHMGWLTQNGMVLRRWRTT